MLTTHSASCKLVPAPGERRGNRPRPGWGARGWEVGGPAQAAALAPEGAGPPCQSPGALPMAPSAAGPTAVTWLGATLSKPRGILITGSQQSLIPWEKVLKCTRLQPQGETRGRGVEVALHQDPRGRLGADATARLPGPSTPGRGLGGPCVSGQGVLRNGSSLGCSAGRDTPPSPGHALLDPQDVTW